MKKNVQIKCEHGFKVVNNFSHGFYHELKVIRKLFVCFFLSENRLKRGDLFSLSSKANL